MYCVNFLGDGRKEFTRTREGNRTGDAEEAADWVSFCNDPDSRERRATGVREPYNLRIWQIGNETSYGTARFTEDEAIGHTIEFAKAMRRRDPSIRLIGWGDWQRSAGETLWAGDMLERAGEHLDYVAIHLMGQRPTRKDTVLRGLRYQYDPAQAWHELLELSNAVETRVRSLEEVVAAKKPSCHIAVTEGHLSLSPHNTNPILLEWLSGVYHARSMNIYQRHGAKVKIATCADFCGTRWTVNAVLMQPPSGVSYLTPAGSVMRLFGRYNGRQGVAVASAPTDLDIAASRDGNRFWLHVANMRFSGSVRAAFAVPGLTIASGRVLTIAPENVREYVNQDQPDALRPKETALPSGPAVQWTFPAASVSALYLSLICICVVEYFDVLCHGGIYYGF
jgi:alpha-L-arabinofuranosidase